MALAFNMSNSQRPDAGFIRRSARYAPEKGELERPPTEAAQLVLLLLAQPRLRRSAIFQNWPG